MSIFGSGGLNIVQGNMAQEHYKPVLEHRLIHQLREWGLPKGFTGTWDFIYMHDVTPCHKVCQVTTFLEDHGLRYCHE